MLNFCTWNSARARTICQIQLCTANCSCICFKFRRNLINKKSNFYFLQHIISLRVHTKKQLLEPIFSWEQIDVTMKSIFVNKNNEIFIILTSAKMNSLLFEYGLRQLMNILLNVLSNLKIESVQQNVCITFLMVHEIGSEKSTFSDINDSASNACPSARAISQCTLIYFLKERDNI